MGFSKVPVFLCHSVFSSLRCFQPTSPMSFP